MRTIALTGLAVLLGTFAAAAAADPAELERQRARWHEAAVPDYAYGYQKYCECHREAPPETVVTVADGRVVRVHHVHADSEREVPAREGSLDLYWTVDGLFGLIETALAREATVRVRYDETLGYPAAVYVDYDAELVGDELDIRVTRFEPGAG